MKRLSLLTALLLVGCQSDREEAYFPLRPGREWTYQVRTPFAGYVETLKVGPVISVAGVKGYRLQGTMGETRLAWHGGTLLADRIGSIAFDPPVVLLDPAELAKAEKETKRGEVPVGLVNQSPKASAPAGVGPAKVTLSETRVKFKFHGREEKGIRANLTVSALGAVYELESDFLPGHGLIRQEHLTNGAFDLEMNLLAETDRRS